MRASCISDIAMDRNVNEDKNGLIWGKWKLDDSTWVLTNRWMNFCYLLIGEEKALLIDTGYGEGNIKQIASEITNKPIVVANTHGHSDHAGGNFWWNECYCLSGSDEDFKETVCKEEYQDYIKKLPMSFQYNYMDNGTILDLGKRKIEVIQVRAHARSSMILLDQTKRVLYTGDEVDPGQVLLVFHGEIPVEERIQLHLEAMRTLESRQGEYDILCPSHNGICISKDYIKDFRILDEQLLSGTADIKNSVSGFNWPADVSDNSDLAMCYPASRAQYGNASIVYR